jgi:hypothetical protein
MVEKRNAFGILVVKPEDTVLRPRHRWEDNINTYLKEIGWECVDWTHKAQNKGQQVLVNSVMNLQVP